MPSSPSPGVAVTARIHLHVIVLDGLCEPDDAGDVRFHGTSGLDAEVMPEVRQRIRTQLIRHASARGFLESHEAQQMLSWAHGGGFRLDANVLIRAHDRDGLERLIREFARPAFAHERLRHICPERFRYDAPKPSPKGNMSLIVSPLELLDRLAALIPPPRTHRHRYFGCLAPNAPLRAPLALRAQAYSTLPNSQALCESHRFTPPRTDGRSRLREPIPSSAASTLFAYTRSGPSSRI